MKIIDLTHTIWNGMPIYPGDPAPFIDSCLTHENDYCHVDVLRLGSHTGTHIDAPYHFLREGRKIDEIAVEQFIGEGVLVDVSDKSDREMIEEKDVEPYTKKIRKGDFVIFRTGGDKHFGTPKWYKHPFLSADCAEFLCDLHVALVGTDAMNPDATFVNATGPSTAGTDSGVGEDYTYPVHHILFNSNILIVENLCNLNRIRQTKGIYSFLPLKLRDSDGSPIRAVYIDMGK
jgi:arylformamidase